MNYYPELTRLLVSRDWKNTEQCLTYMFMHSEMTRKCCALSVTNEDLFDILLEVRVVTFRCRVIFLADSDIDVAC
ncbi:unnamed protein product [Soboliphyme baturini]|uniref:Ovule protein n=1 Tax=Soboliphyme baturini TaxID=241478 RepID=A0A183IAF5_9BILA|nr:unnamed protein product [Soboliphyme baturini]